MHAFEGFFLFILRSLSLEGREGFLMLFGEPFSWHFLRPVTGFLNKKTWVSSLDVLL